MHFRPVRTKYAVAVLGSWPRGQSSKGRAPRAELQGQSSKGSVMSSVFAHSSATFLLEILEPVKTNSRAECLADGAWPVSPNMKHRATIKGLNESTDTNWQTQTDCHNKHNQNWDWDGRDPRCPNNCAQMCHRQDPEPELGVLPAGSREEIGCLLTSSDTRRNTVSSFFFLGSQITTNQLTS